MIEDAWHDFPEKTVRSYEPMGKKKRVIKNKDDDNPTWRPKHCKYCNDTGLIDNGYCCWNCQVKR